MIKNQICTILMSIWRKITNCAKLFFPWDVAKVFCNSKLHHGWWNFRQIDGISAFWRNFSVNSFKNLFFGTFLRKIHKLCYSVYLANNIKILLHDFWLGCNGSATSLGSHFIHTLQKSQKSLCKVPIQNSHGAWIVRLWWYQIAT